MKRNPKPFSVEIKKTRIPGQRSHLLPRRPFATIPAEATKTFQKKEPQTAAEQSPAPRILPSIVEPMWSSSGPIETVRRKRFSVEVTQGQMEFDLAATALEDVADALAEALLIAKAVPQTDDALDDVPDALPVCEVQPAQSEGVKAKPRKPRKKASEAVERETASELIPESATTLLSMTTSSDIVQRRLTKRLSAVAQLPRHERWKGRLHPAAW